MGLSQLDWGYPQLPLEHAAEVAIAYAQFASQLRHSTPVERAGGNSMCSHPSEPRHRVAHGSSRCQLRPTAETGPESGSLGRGGRFEEPASVVIRDASGANRPAVYASGGDADEEDAVESGITRVQCTLAHVGV